MENNLKKEFSKRDVQRMRNLITGNVTDRTQVQAGYEKEQKVYREGDIWEENEKTWTIKNGLKQTVTRFDDLKKLAVLPLTCPECKLPLKNTPANKKMYTVHQKCLNCVIDMEAKLKLEGKFEDYQKAMLNQNKNDLLKDLEQALDSWMLETSSYVSEDGDVESWKGGSSKQTMYDQAKEELKKGRETEI